MRTLADEVAEQANDVVHDLRLRLIRCVHDAQAFGNAIAVYETPELAILISKDRNQYFIAVARLTSHPRAWKELQLTLGRTGALDVLGGENPDCSSLRSCMLALSRSYRQLVGLVNTTEFGTPDGGTSTPDWYDDSTTR